MSIKRSSDWRRWYNGEVYVVAICLYYCCRSTCWAAFWGVGKKTYQCIFLRESFKRGKNSKGGGSCNLSFFDDITL